MRRTSLLVVNVADSQWMKSRILLFWKGAAPCGVTSWSEKYLGIRLWRMTQHMTCVLALFGDSLRVKASSHEVWYESVVVVPPRFGPANCLVLNGFSQCRLIVDLSIRAGPIGTGVYPDGLVVLTSASRMMLKK